MSAGFILDEDAALKAKVQGITVKDGQGNNVRVLVRYLLPQSEEGSLIAQYPLITIGLIDINEAFERDHRGYIMAPNYDGATPFPHSQTEGATPPPHPAGFSWATPGPGSATPVPGLTPLYQKHQFPIPINLDYQITSYTRDVVHDRAITAQLQTPDRLARRFGYLVVGPTVRRLDFLGFQVADTIVGEKRLFRKVYTVRVSSELEAAQIDTIYQVLRVTPTFKYKVSDYDSYQPDR